MSELRRKKDLHLFASQHCSVCAPLSAQYFRPTSVHTGKFCAVTRELIECGGCVNHPKPQKTHTHTGARVHTLLPKQPSHVRVCQWAKHLKGWVLNRANRSEYWEMSTSWQYTDDVSRKNRASTFIWAPWGPTHMSYQCHYASQWVTVEVMWLGAKPKLIKSFKHSPL